MTRLTRGVLTCEKTRRLVTTSAPGDSVVPTPSRAAHVEAGPDRGQPKRSSPPIGSGARKYAFNASALTPNCDGIMPGGTVACAAPAPAEPAGARTTVELVDSQATLPFESTGPAPGATRTDARAPIDGAAREAHLRQAPAAVAPGQVAPVGGELHHVPRARHHHPAAASPVEALPAAARVSAGAAVVRVCGEVSAARGFGRRGLTGLFRHPLERGVVEPTFRRRSSVRRRARSLRHRLAPRRPPSTRQSHRPPVAWPEQALAARPAAKT